MLAEIGKREVYDKVSEALEERILEVRNLIERFQDAANIEEKNTAGDKHEVSKAQMQWEVEKANRQLANLINMKRILLRIDPLEEHNMVSAGSLIKTDRGFFYIAVSLGKIVVEHENVMCMSSITPLAQEILGKKAGDEVAFNEASYKIERIH